MTENNVLEFTGREEIFDPLTELLKSGVQQLIRHAVEAELAEYYEPVFGAADRRR